MIARVALVFALAWVPLRAEAACDTTGSDTAYGDYWIERSGANCDCLFKARTYSCVATGGNRTESAPVTLATVSGDCAYACEDLSGYSTGLATARGYYVAGAGYNCDTTFTDADSDGYGACIDQDEGKSRVGAKTTGINERLCDGVDNDSDGTVDDGFTACPLDLKRTSIQTNRQGTGANQVDVTELYLTRTEVDAVIAGTYAPLVFARTYNSRRATNDADLGHGWTHSFAIYLKAMPSGDDRYQVQTSSGEMQYFRCDAGTTDRSCVIDDHNPAGTLRRISSVWYYYPGDGSRYAFSETAYSGRQPYTTHVDTSGYVLSTATVDGSGRYTRIDPVNNSYYFYFTYDSDGMTSVHVSSSGSGKIVELDISAETGGWKRLNSAKFASAVNTIDSDTFVAYTYNASTWNLESVTSKIDASTTLTLATMTYDGSDRLLTLKDAEQDLTFALTTATQTNVTYNVEASGNPTNYFYHNTRRVTARNTVVRAGGISAQTEVRDDHGRITCQELDDSRMIKLDYTSSWNPVRTDYYGKTGNCSSGGTVERQLWHEYAYNSARQSWRPVWTREKSVYSPASSCTGASLPSGCRETKYEYVSSSDDRIQWVTETGSTRSTAGTVSQVVRKYRTYYFGLDTGTCASSGDWYTGLPCQTETQSSGGTVYSRAAYTYHPSGTNKGMPKTIAYHRSSSDSTPLTTTFGSPNLFGTPTTVTSPAGVVTTYTLNGWNAPTQIVEASAILDDAEYPTASSLTTVLAYNKLRALSRTTMPKLNYEDTIYYTGATDYARVKARAALDTSANKVELMRYIYDKFGNVIEDRVLDSINGTTPCTDEDCTTYDMRNERKFNANRQVVEAYLHAADTSNPPDATQSYTYTTNQLTQVTDYRGTVSAITYDSQGRVATRTEDNGGLGAQTQLAYDLQGRTATVTAPAGVITFYEYDDFGQLVIERSKTRGDIRYDYDIAGAETKRRRTAHKSLASPEDTCSTTDWLGRQTAVDYTCNATNDWTFSYDGVGTPSSACPTTSKQTGQLSMMVGPDFTRVLCYHPNGRLYGAYQVESTTWSNSTARGTQRIYDANGNLLKEFINAHPSSRADARIVEYVYHSTMGVDLPRRAEFDS